mmetsp:Transcript_91199/g.258228  ORF Transcript_91199/g.258228 Transcript_91199/m.258228 type:complete len:218 (+) Transcript_91199:214-867(+)
MVSMLSSARPLVWPRCSRRLSMHSSEHSMTRQNCRRVFIPRMLSQAAAFSTFRGKPSTKNLPLSQPRRRISASKSSTVTSEGTILPSLMQLSMSSPALEPDLWRSARRRSPALRWAKPNRSTIRVENVPLPQPGPPSTKTTSGPVRPSSPAAARPKCVANCVRVKLRSIRKAASGPFWPVGKPSQASSAKTQRKKSSISTGPARCELLAAMPEAVKS